MNGNASLLIILSFFYVGYISVTYAKVNVGVTIHSFSNPNGTAYVETSPARKCCDGPQRATCQTGDTCDTYFHVCVGSEKNQWGCRGVLMESGIYNNTNNITNVPELRGTSDYWDGGMTIFVFIRDDDTKPGTNESHDHIDTLIDRLNFNPDSQELLAQVHDYYWEGKTQLSLSVKVWCAKNYYGPQCANYCKGIQQIAICDRQTGKLECQDSDEVLLEFKTNITEDQQPQLSREVNSFMANEVCPGQSEVDYPLVDVASNTLSFTAFCNNRQISPMEFKSLLQLKTDQALTAYFPAGLVRGPVIAPKNYGEHIVPNVYIGIEIKSFDHPLGTANRLDGRRCCDTEKMNNCGQESDTCDVYFSICIGKVVNGECIGAYVSSLTFTNTLSLELCGPTLLDRTNGSTFISHPMIGAMRLTENTTGIDVTIMDSDQGGLTFDVIDHVNGTFKLSIGDNVTDTQETEVMMTNIVTLKLRILAWCAPGHAGPSCLAVSGNDTCSLGWYGPDCAKKVDLCHPNPCGDGRCTAVFGSVNCTCPPGLQGPTCSDDVNECQQNVCQNNGTCTNKFGSFICHCPPAWDGLICTDRSPVCYPSPCIYGDCSLSQDGGYRCACASGWTGKNCNQKFICDNSTCVNGHCFMGKCLCFDGFFGQGCDQDVDECQQKPCINSGTCTNTPGSFICTCQTGFGGKLCQNKTDPCTDYCKNGGICVTNTTGTPHCFCQGSWSGPQCENLDLCARVICAHNSTCEQLMDDFDFYCDCDEHWQGKLCDEDVNECKRNSFCHNNASCTNSAGSYNCSCQKGWTGHDCGDDIDECVTQLNICGDNGACINSPGSFQCYCNSGYTGELCQTTIQHCVNVTCSNNGTCQNDKNGYLCACQDGWMGSSCQEDKNECNLNYCSVNAFNCTNFRGGYNCTCKEGWGGVNCLEDVDECTSRRCHGNGVCSNTEGGFNCNCYSGFTGSECDVFINQCAFRKCVNGGTCHVTGSTTECVCTNAWTGDQCQFDVNECDVYHPCKNFAQCSNKNGSFECSCIQGWSGPTCANDVNECINTRCENGGICSNLPGSYKCACQTGWQGQKCEILIPSSLAGTVFEMQFVHNITALVKEKVISSIYKFIQHTCGGQEVKLFIRSVVGSVVEFVSTCGNTSLTESLLLTAFHNVPPSKMETLFPVPFTGVWKSQTEDTPKPTGSQSWMHDHWPVLAGCLGAAVIITVVVVIGCFRDKKLKQKEEQGFINPTFSSDQTNYS